MRYRFNDTLCIDNFYEDPDEVRNFALSSYCQYSRNITEGYPGIRSLPLKNSLNISNYVMHKKYHDLFLKILKDKCSLFDPDKFKIREVTFHKTPLFSKDINSKLNTGFIHTDNQNFRKSDSPQKFFAGVLYLNKVVNNPNSGTTIFKLKKSSEYDIKLFNPVNSFLLENLKFKQYKQDNFIDYERVFWEYQKMYNTFLKRERYLKKYIYYKNIVDSEFEPVKSFKNVYNRLVIYDSTYFHTSTETFVNDFEDRLTQVFFAIEK